MWKELKKMALDREDIKDYNIPLNSDGTVTVYHGTKKDNAQQIKDTGYLTSAGEDSVFVSTFNEGLEYGDGTVVKLRVPYRILELNDMFPSGRLDFSIKLPRGGKMPVRVEEILYGMMPEDFFHN